MTWSYRACIFLIEVQYAAMNSEIRNNEMSMDILRDNDGTGKPVLNVLNDLNNGKFEEQTFDPKTVQAIAETFERYEEDDFDPISPSTNELIEEELKKVDTEVPLSNDYDYLLNWALNEDIENNKGNSGSNIELPETTVEISEHFLKLTTNTRSDVSLEGYENSLAVQSLTRQNNCIDTGNVGQLPYTADGIQKDPVSLYVFDYNAVPSTSSQVPPFPIGSPTEELKTDLLQWQKDNSCTGFDFLPNPLSPNVSDRKVVLSTSFGVSHSPIESHIQVAMSTDMIADYDSTGKSMAVLNYVNFEEKMFDQQSMQAVTNHAVPVNEEDLYPLQSSNTDDFRQLFFKDPTATILSNEYIANSDENIQELGTSAEITEALEKSATDTRSEPHQLEGPVSFPWQNIDVDATYGIQKNPMPSNGSSCRSLQSTSTGISVSPNHSKIGEPNDPLASQQEHICIKFDSSGCKVVPATSSGVSPFPIESPSGELKTDSLACQNEHTKNLMDFQQPSTSKASQSKIVPSTSSGTKFALPVTKSETSRKRGRPLKQPTPPSKTFLEGLSEEKQRIYIQKYKNNVASRQSRQKKKLQEHENETEFDRLLKKNKNLNRKKSILEEHSRRLNEESIRI